MKIKQIILFIIVFAAFGISAQAQTTPALSEAQLAKMKEIREASAKKAAPAALELAATVKQIYDNMLSEKEDPNLRKKLSKQMDKAAAQLFAVKGQSIRDMLGVLTPEQKQIVKAEMMKPGASADLGEIMERVFILPKM